ncbi:MAG: Preprotein translocase subunit SecB [Lachnospiraceae bacterium]|nr:Preprotein translocase subunit SecB [Lachnospiraceae bacterium]MCI8873195.1 Preprotein translocase subunit SecB [Lachnospiraceae bacterium]MCI9059081.1 Preprotein translocase subunit SecB [Lachnospiraceae bacterium]
MQMQHEGDGMGNYNSILNLQRLVFERIEFDRKGFKNTQELKFELQAQIGLDENGIYKVTLVLNGTKQDEYDIVISLSGFFKFEGQVEDKMGQDLISKNAVAILMPYLRSEVTLLTAQPDTDSVVLPPFNINKMFGN